MTFTATGEPLNDPPRVLLDLDTDTAGATFNTLSVTRDGTLLRQQPPTGTQTTSTYDYEMPFGQLVEYVAQGDFLPFVAPDWSETWPTPYILVSDTYDRANSAVTMGSPETGSAWTAHLGTFGIQTNLAYLVSGTATSYNMATIDTGTADAVVEVTVSTMAASGFTGLLLRSSGAGTGLAVLNNRVWNVATDAAVGPAFADDNGAVSFVSGDRMAAAMLGTSITIFRQAAATGPWVQVMTTTTSVFLANTRHGITVWDNTAGALLSRFNNFQVLTGMAWTGDTLAWTVDSAAADKFTRTNSAVSMGTAPTGGAWTAHGGVWGIDTNRAYCATGVAAAYSGVTLNTGMSDCTVETTITTFGTSGYGGLFVRASDINNGFLTLPWGMTRLVAGAEVVVGNFSTVFVDGDRMRIVMSGDTITVYRQAGAVGPYAEVLAFTDANNMTNVRHGFNEYGTGSTNARFDDFLVYGGTVSSDTYFSSIQRTASGAIQRLVVEEPETVVVGVASADDTASVLVSFAIPGTVVLSGDETVDTPGSGSFTLTLLNGLATATGVDGWTLSTPYSGDLTKVVLYSVGGSLIETSAFPISATTPGEIAMTRAASGNFYTVERTNNLVRKYGPTGTFLTSWSTTGSPNDIDVDSAENVYVTDSTNSLVRKYTSAGAAVTTWSTTGTPAGIGIDGSDQVYVVDQTAGRVRKYTSTGTVVTSWNTGLVDDFYLAVTPTGTVLVSDWDNDTAGSNFWEIYNSTGTFLDDDGWDNLIEPRGVAIDANYVYATSNTAITVQNYDGTSVAVVDAAGSTLRGIHADQAGSIYVTDIFNDQIRKFSSGTASIGSITATPAVDLVPFLESATVTVDIDEAWLIHPGQPALSVSIGAGTWRDDGINVDPLSSQQTTAKSAVTLHQPVGRTRSVAIATGNRLEDEWDLVLLTPRVVDRDAVRAIVHDQTPLLLRSPTAFNWDLPDGFYTVGDLPINRLTPDLTHGYRRITLPLIPSDSPVVATADERTYASVLLDSVDYAGLLLIYDTYTDLLLGTV